MTNDELNKAMAEKVMGWHVMSLHKLASDYWVDNEDKIQIACGHWNPATDANDALRVVEAMREKGWAYSIMGLTVQFYGKSKAGSNVYRQTADSVMTLPRAICDAAFQAEAAAKEVSDAN